MSEGPEWDRLRAAEEKLRKAESALNGERLATFSVPASAAGTSPASAYTTAYDPWYGAVTEQTRVYLLPKEVEMLCMSDGKYVRLHKYSHVGRSGYFDEARNVLYVREDV